VNPRLSDLVSAARVVSIPLRTKFRGITERELLVFEGPNGFTEWAAFIEYSDEEAAAWLSAAIEWGFADLPTPKRTSVPVNAILPAVAPADVAKILTRAGKFQTVKIKTAEKAQTVSDDLARILEVRGLYPEAKIRLDANGGYQLAQAMELLEKLQFEGIELEYFEQPVATIAELAEMKIEVAKTGQTTLIAADESVRKSSDPLAVELAGAADILVLKSAPLGGIASALEIAASSKLPIVPSSAMQSSIGLGAELHFAACLEDLSFDAGLGTMNLFAGDLVKDSLKPVDGVLEVRKPEVSTSALDTLKAEDHRYDWWIARLQRCGRLIGLEA
jgi:O-succinylbenzoate synthase